MGDGGRTSARLLARVPGTVLYCRPTSPPCAGSWVGTVSPGGSARAASLGEGEPLLIVALVSAAVTV